MKLVILSVLLVVHSAIATPTPQFQGQIAFPPSIQLTPLSTVLQNLFSPIRQFTNILWSPFQQQSQQPEQQQSVQPVVQQIVRPIIQPVVQQPFVQPAQGNLPSQYMGSSQVVQLPPTAYGVNHNQPWYFNMVPDWVSAIPLQNGWAQQPNTQEPTIIIVSRPRPKPQKPQHTTQLQATAEIPQQNGTVSNTTVSNIAEPSTTTPVPATTTTASTSTPIATEEAQPSTDSPAPASESTTTTTSTTTTAAPSTQAPSSQSGGIFYFVPFGNGTASTDPNASHGSNPPLAPIPIDLTNATGLGLTLLNAIPQLNATGSDVPVPFAIELENH